MLRAAIATLQAQMILLLAMGESSFATENNSTSFESNNFSAAILPPLFDSSNLANGLVSTTIGYNDIIQSNWSMAISDASITQNAKQDDEIVLIKEKLKKLEAVLMK